MKKNEFINILNEGKDKLFYRNALIEACLDHPEWMLILLKKITISNNESSNFAARIYELVCKNNIELSLLYLDDFCSLLDKIKSDAVTRFSAKVCELITIEYFINRNPLFIKTLTDDHFEKITEAGFQWMITDQKIAVQAYTMQTLYLLGTKYPWIHDELALTIEKNMPHGSAGYKNRGNKVIKAIKTDTPLKL